MIKIERILVPVDFSESSQKALRYGHELARERNGRLYVLHVINQRIIDALHDMSAKGYKGEFVEVLKKVVNERKEELDRFVPASMREGIEIEFETRKGRPAEEVIKFARDNRIDLIILGNVGRSALEAALVGSVARSVANHAPCPVLLVRPVEHDFIA
jgi:universal stress protein A